MKRQLALLVALLATSSLVGCGGKKKSSSSSELPPSTTSEIPSTSSSSSTSTSVAPVMTGISVNTDNVRKEYINGDALNLTGLVVTLNYSDGSSQPVTNYTSSPANGAILNTHGAQNVTISFENFTASFDVTVGVKLTGITVDSTYVRKDYFLNRALDLDGLVVNANYSDGSSQPVTNYTSNPAEGTRFESTGEHTVTISYQSFSGSFSVNVIDGTTPIVVPDPDSSAVVDNTNKYYPDELIVNNRLVSVLTRGNDEEPNPDSTYQLEALPQFGYSGKNVTFTSNNPAIATVSETGLITGISAGQTTVVVADKDNPNFKTEVPVYVSPEIDIDAATAINDGLKTISATEDPKLTAICDNEMWMRTIYRTDANNNTELYSYDRWDQRFVASQDDAYFRIWETDAEINSVEGAMDFTNYDWIFHTDEYYETFIFHQTGDIKAYLDVPTQNYLDIEGHKRTDPLLDVLDNLFTSGKSYFNNVFKNARLDGMTDLVGYSRAKNVHYGSRGENSFFLDATIRFDERSDLDDENRYGIPYDTAEIIDQRMMYTIENNRVAALALELDETYSYGGYDYHAIYQINHTYQDLDNEKSQIYVPALKDYTEVDDLFDL